MTLIPAIILRILLNMSLINYVMQSGKVMWKQEETLICRFLHCCQLNKRSDINKGLLGSSLRLISSFQVWLCHIEVIPKFWHSLQLQFLWWLRKEEDTAGCTGLTVEVMLDIWNMVKASGEVSWPDIYIYVLQWEYCNRMEYGTI